MKFFRVIFFLLFSLAWPLMAIDCPGCGTRGLPGLVMVCPECSASLHDPVVQLKNQEKAKLCIRLLYTGDKPDRLPAYGKLYINGKYLGNIDLAEKEERSQDFEASWSDGLGREYTAVYEKICDQIAPGILKIEIEMKFDRLYGLGRSFKRVVFPYVGFKGGEKTTVEHYFNSAATFHQYKPGKRKPIPVVSEAKIQAANGTVALNIGLFK